MANRQMGRIVVETDDGEPLKLHFYARDVFDETIARLEEEEFKVIDTFWGYALFTDPEEAVTCVKAFCK